MLENNFNREQISIPRANKSFMMSYSDFLAHVVGIDYFGKAKRQFLYHCTAQTNFSLFIAIFTMAILLIIFAHWYTHQSTQARS